MKRSSLLIGLGLILSLLFTGPFCSPAQAQDKVITLNYAHFMPIMTKQAQLSEQWCREVEKENEWKGKDYLLSWWNPCHGTTRL